MSKLLAALQQVEAPKVPLREIQHQTYTAQRVNPAMPRTDGNVAGQLLETLKGATQLYGGYVEQRTKVGSEKASRVLQNIPPEKIGEFRRDGTLLYQDDPYAMRELDRIKGRQLAYSVDEIINKRAQAGEFDDKAHMERERAAAMDKAYKEGSTLYGIQEDNAEWYREGFRSDLVERNLKLYNAQAVRQHQREVSTANTNTQQQTTDMVKSGYSDKVFDSIEDARAKGILRTDDEVLAQLKFGASEMANLPNNMTSFQTFMNRKFTLDSAETTLRTVLGEETYRVLEQKAADATLNYSQDNDQWVTDNLSRLSNPPIGQGKTLEEVRTEWLERNSTLLGFIQRTQGTEAATKLTKRFNEAVLAGEAKFNAANEKAANEHAKKAQEGNRYNLMYARTEAAVNGAPVPLSLDSYTETAETGKFDTNDLNMFADKYAEDIKNDKSLTDEQRANKLMTVLRMYGRVNDKAGFGAQMTAMNDTATDELVKYTRASTMGSELPKTPVMDSLMQMHSADPAGFMATFGDKGIVFNEIAMAKQMGVHPSIISAGRMKLESLSKEERTAADLEFANMFTNKSDVAFKRLPAEYRATMQSVYYGMEGYTSGEKVSRLRKMADDTYHTFDADKSFGQNNTIRGSIPKAALMVDPSKTSSVSDGISELRLYIKEVMPKAVNVDIAMHTNDIFVIRSEHGIELLSQQQLRERWMAKQKTK